MAQWAPFIHAVYTVAVQCTYIYIFCVSFRYLNWRLYFAKCTDTVTVICTLLLLLLLLLLLVCHWFYIRRWRWWQWESNTFASYMDIRVLQFSLKMFYANFMTRTISEKWFFILQILGNIINGEHSMKSEEKKPTL